MRRGWEVQSHRVQEVRKICLRALPFVRGQLFRVLWPRFALRTVVVRGWRCRARVAVRRDLRGGFWQALNRSAVLRALLRGGRAAPRALHFAVEIPSALYVPAHTPRVTR